MLGRPGNLEAVGLGRLHLFDGIVIKLIGLAARCAVAHQVELAKVHRRPPRARPLRVTWTRAVTHAHAGSAIAIWLCKTAVLQNCSPYTRHGNCAWRAAAPRPRCNLGTPSRGPKSGPQLGSKSDPKKSGSKVGITVAAAVRCRAGSAGSGAVGLRHTANWAVS